MDNIQKGMLEQGLDSRYHCCQSRGFSPGENACSKGQDRLEKLDSSMPIAYMHKD